MRLLGFARNDIFGVADLLKEFAGHENRTYLKNTNIEDEEAYEDEYEARHRNPNRTRRRPRSCYFYLTACFPSLYSDNGMAVIQFGRTVDSS